MPHIATNLTGEYEKGQEYHESCHQHDGDYQGRIIALVIVEAALKAPSESRSCFEIVTVSNDESAVEPFIEVD